MTVENDSKEMMLFPLRFSVSMAEKFNEFTEKMGETTSKSQAAQYLLSKYLASPIYIDVMEDKVLREPRVKHMTLSLPKSHVEQLGNLAKEYGISVSACFRIALFKGLFYD